MLLFHLFQVHYWCFLWILAKKRNCCRSESDSVRDLEIWKDLSSSSVSNTAMIMVLFVLLFLTTVTLDTKITQITTVQSVFVMRRWEKLHLKNALRLRLFQRGSILSLAFHGINTKSGRRSLWKESLSDESWIQGSLWLSGEGSGPSPEVCGVEHLQCDEQTLRNWVMFLGSLGVAQDFMGSKKKSLCTKVHSKVLNIAIVERCSHCVLQYLVLPVNLMTSLNKWKKFNHKRLSSWWQFFFNSFALIFRPLQKLYAAPWGPRPLLWEPLP